MVATGIHYLLSLVVFRQWRAQNEKIFRNMLMKYFIFLIITPTGFPSCLRKTDLDSIKVIFSKPEQSSEASVSARFGFLLSRH